MIRNVSAAIDHTPSMWPNWVRMHLPVATSQSLIVLSREEVRMWVGKELVAGTKFRTGNEALVVAALVAFVVAVLGCECWCG